MPITAKYWAANLPRVATIEQSSRCHAYGHVDFKAVQRGDRVFPPPADQRLLPSDN